MRRNFHHFCYSVSEVFVLLGCYVVYVGSCITGSCLSKPVSQYATTNIYCTTTQKRKDHMNSIITVSKQLPTYTAQQPRGGKTT